MCWIGLGWVEECVGVGGIFFVRGLVAEIGWTGGLAWC